jgi:hypothetical protein
VFGASGLRIENLSKFLIAVAFLKGRGSSKLKSIALIPNNLAFPEVAMGDNITNDKDLFNGMGK